MTASEVKPKLSDAPVNWFQFWMRGRKTARIVARRSMPSEPVHDQGAESNPASLIVRPMSIDTVVLALDSIPQARIRVL